MYIPGSWQGRGERLMKSLLGGFVCTLVVWWLWWGLFRWLRLLFWAKDYIYSPDLYRKPFSFSMFSIAFWWFTRNSILHLPHEHHTFVAHALTVQPRLKHPFALFLWSVTSVLWLSIGFFSCFCSTASNSNRSTPACSPVLRKRSRSPTPQSPEGENMVEKNSDHSSDKSPSTPEQAVQRTYSQSLHNTRTGGKNSKVNVWLTVLTVLLLSPSSYTVCLAHILLLWGQILHQCRLVNSILRKR